MNISIQRLLAHRANLFFEGLMMLIGLASGIIALMAVFQYVDTLAGWTIEGTIVLLGTYQMVSGLISTFVASNLALPWSLFQTLLGMIIVSIGMWGADADLVGIHVLVYILQVIAGLIIAWASRVVLASLAFWAPGFEPSVLYDAFWEMGRYPVDNITRMFVMYSHISCLLRLLRRSRPMY